MTSAPVRLDRLQAGLAALVALRAPGTAFVWAPAEYPRATAGASLVAAKILTGPSVDGAASVRVVSLPTAATWTATAATAGSTVVLRASGRAWEYQVQAGDDVTAVRNGMLAAIGANPMVSASFTSSGAASIAIVADALGDLYGLEAAGSATMTATASTVAEAQVETVASLIELQAYSTELSPRLGASALLSKIRGGLRLGSAQRTLDAYGLSIRDGFGNVVNLDALSGPSWQSRAALQIRIAQLSIAAEPADLIETVRVDLTVDSLTAEVEAIS